MSGSGTLPPRDGDGQNEPKPQRDAGRVGRERAFIVASSAQRALLRAGDVGQLLDLICKIAVEEAGYALAWIGLVDDDPTRTVRPVAQCGDEAGLESIETTWADIPPGQGPIGTAIRAGRAFIGRSFVAEPVLAPWRDHAVRHGFDSCVVLPLRSDDGPIGALTIYATEPDAFTQQDTELLTGLADELAFGITVLRERAMHASAEERLRASERSLAKAQRMARIGSWKWDAATDTLEVSDEMCRILGIEPGTFDGTNDAYMAFVHADDHVATIEAERAALEDDVPLSLDYRIVRADGSVRIIHEVGEVIRDEAGGPIRMVGTAQDITERALLEAQRTRVARLLDELSSEIYVFDAGTLRFTEANTGALRNIGYTLDDLRDMTPLDLKTELSPETFTELLAPLRTGLRDQVAFETTHRRKDGTMYPVEVRVHLLATETPPVFVTVLQDITERVAADAERARLASAVEQTGDSVWMQDLDNIVTYVNRSFSRVYGYEPHEIVGQYAGIVDSGHHDPGFFAELWASVKAGRTWAGSIGNRRKDGSTVEVDAVISGIRGPDGRVVSYLQTDRDVTHVRALEGALQRAARERETIEAALAQIDPADPPEAIAATACAEIVGLAEIESAWAIGFGDGKGRILAAAGRLGQTLAVGSVVPETQTRHLRERAETGQWTETWQTRTEDGAYGDVISTSGLHTAGYAALKGPRGVIGVIGVGAHDPLSAQRIIERLPALATFGAIVGTLVAPGLVARGREDDARARIQAILDARAFTPFFQPIVELHTGAVVGYEALSRFASGLPPDAVFALAVRAGLNMELETTTIRAALETAKVLPSQAYLSLNVSPALIESGVLREILDRSERDIVLEITEHAVIDDYPAIRRELARLGPTVRLAVDDAGAGYASLRHILELAPDLVKLDIGLTRGIHADPARQALVAGMGYFATKRRIHLIAEGLETIEDLEALRAIAVPYGQGYLLGRPQDGRGTGPWPEMIARARS